MKIIGFHKKNPTRFYPYPQQKTIINFLIIIRKMDIINNYRFIDFEMNKEARYSLTKPFEASQIAVFVLDSLPNIEDRKEIIDASCGVGGDSITFSRYFEIVHSVEINPETYELLLRNIQKFGAKNIMTYNVDFLLFIEENIEMIKRIKAIYIDCPWAGPAYKFKKTVKLYMSEIPIDEVIDRIFKINKEIIIFMKVPFNVEMTNYEHYVVDFKVIINRMNQKKFQVLKIAQPKTT